MNNWMRGLISFHALLTCCRNPWEPGSNWTLAPVGRVVHVAHKEQPGAAGAGASTGGRPCHLMNVGHQRHPGLQQRRQQRPQN